MPFSLAKLARKLELDAVEALVAKRASLCTVGLVARTCPPSWRHSMCKRSSRRCEIDESHVYFMLPQAGGGIFEHSAKLLVFLQVEYMYMIASASDW